MGNTYSDGNQPTQRSGVFSRNEDQTAEFIMSGGTMSGKCVNGHERELAI
jgi:hypothetical protein